MKRNPKASAWLVGFLFVMLLGVIACTCEKEPDPEPEPTPVVATFQFNVSAECKAIDADGNEITELTLSAGTSVEYCNQWNAKAEIKFTASGFVPSGSILTLEAGQCVTHVVDANVTEGGSYSWSLTCEGGPTSGMGGGPVKVDNPPPGP